MGTKNEPGKYDCEGAALPAEPKFTLLARDPDFFRLLNEWANKREMDIWCGERPPSDTAKVKEARQCAVEGAEWRRKNLGAWRKP